MNEADRILYVLIQQVKAAHNDFKDKLITNITCEHIWTIDNIVSLLLAENIWVEHKRIENNSYLLKLEW